MLTLERLKKVLRQSRQYNMGPHRFGKGYGPFLGEVPISPSIPKSSAHSSVPLEIPVERVKKDTSK